MDSILMPNEIEFFVDTMKPQTLSNIGSKTWLEWHQRLQKLNQEAVVEASNLKDEHVKETLVCFGKVPVLVHEAILINIWRYKVLPHILRLEPNPQNTFIAYSVLYHEAVCVALLELVMYHANCAESLSDFAIDLLDYACGLAAQLLVIESQDALLVENEKIELQRQQNNLVFDLGIRALSIIRYLSEYLDGLPLSMATLMFNTHDVPVLLIQILLDKPWYKDGKLYSGGRWLVQRDEALCQAEAQVWLALHQLLTHSSCATHYSIPDSRRAQLMKLFPLMSPVLLDQLSPLMDLKQWLCRISMTDTSSSATTKPVLLEPVMEIKQAILREGEGKWKKIASRQVSVIFNTDPKELMEAAKSLSEAYNTDLLEKFEEKDKHTCKQCGKDAIQRCSRCKSEWYCSRSCQVTHWGQHKEHCIGPSEN